MSDKQLTPAGWRKLARVWIGGEVFEGRWAACSEDSAGAEPLYAAADMERLQAEIDRRFGIGGELIAARRERDELSAERAKLVRVLEAAVTLVCAPAWAGVSDEDVLLERVLHECGFVGPNVRAKRETPHDD